MRMRTPAVLVLSAVFLAASVSAAFAQTIVEGDGDTSTTIVDCSQVQNAVANQGQYGDANATADDESTATARISQKLNISQNQVNACLGQIGSGGNPPGERTPPPKDKTNPPEDGKPREGEKEVIEKTVLADELPETGGPSLLGVAAGIALIAGGASLLRSGRGR